MRNVYLVLFAVSLTVFIGFGMVVNYRDLFNPTVKFPDYRELLHVMSLIPKRFQNITAYYFDVWDRVTSGDILQVVRGILLFMAGIFEVVYELLQAIGDVIRGLWLVLQYGLQSIFAILNGLSVMFEGHEGFVGN